MHPVGQFYRADFVARLSSVDTGVPDVGRICCMGFVSTEIFLRTVQVASLVAVNVGDACRCPHGTYVHGLWNHTASCNAVSLGRIGSLELVCTVKPTMGSMIPLVFMGCVLAGSPVSATVNVVQLTSC